MTYALNEDKLRLYQAEAAKCRRLADDEGCADAREYYEALARDFLKLAALESAKITPRATPRPAEIVA